MIKDYYKILQADRNSGNLEIKKSYRDLAVRLHPDKNKTETAHEDFVELNEAFQILSDEAKRKKYNLLYDHYINKSSAGLKSTAREEFECIRKEARKEGEKISDSNFYMFITEILSEMIGQALFSGLIDGLGTIIKGTGEIIGDALSGLD